MACTSSSALLRVARLRAPVVVAESSARSFSSTLPISRVSIVHHPIRTSKRTQRLKSRKDGTHIPPPNRNLQNDTVLPSSSPHLAPAPVTGEPPVDPYGRYPSFFEDEDVFENELGGRRQDEQEGEKDTVGGQLSEEELASTVSKSKEFFIYPPKPTIRTHHVQKGEDPYQPLLTDYLPPATSSLNTIAARLELDDPAFFDKEDECPRAILQALTHRSFVAPSPGAVNPAAPFSKDTNEITITETSASLTSAYSGDLSSSKTTTSQLSGSEVDAAEAAAARLRRDSSSDYIDFDAPPILSARYQAELYERLQIDNLLDVGDNAQLAAAGNGILGFVLSEYLAKKYPNLPTYTMKLVLDGLTGPDAMKDVGADLGFGQAKGGVKVRYGGVENEFIAMASAVQAVIGLLFERKGMAASSAFINAHFLSRQIDIPALMRFSQPGVILEQAVVRYGLQSPVARLTGESGRFSSAPTFVVGIFCGDIKLGEGWGISQKMATHRAFTNSLHGLYLTQTIKPKMSIAAFTSNPLNSPPNTALERRYASLAPPPGEPAPTHTASGRPPRNWEEPPITAEKAGITLPPTWDSRRIGGPELARLKSLSGSGSSSVKRLGDGDGNEYVETVRRVERVPFEYQESEGWLAYHKEGRKGETEKETRLLRSAFKKHRFPEFIPGAAELRKLRKAPFVSDRKKGLKEREDYIE